MQGATHSHNDYIPPNGFKCDNCLGPHFMNQCPKEFNDTRISKNRETCGADPGRRGRGGCGGRGERRGGTHTGCGCWKFGAPAKDETVHLVDGSAYAACKHYGWNTGSYMHTTSDHEVSKKIGYSVSFALQTKLNKLGGTTGRDDGTPPKKSDNADMLTSMMEQCAAMEKDDGDPDQANFAGMVGTFMQKLLKSKIN